MNTLIEFLNLTGSHFTRFALPMLLQSSLVIVVLLILDRFLRSKVRATVRYGLWMLVLVKLILPPSFTLPTGVAYWWPSQESTFTAALESRVMTSGISPQAAEVIPPASAPLPSVRPPSETRAALNANGGMLVLWLAVAVGLAIWVGQRLGRVARLIKKTEAAPESLCEALELCRLQLNLTRLVPVRVTHDAVSPAICGLWRPVIVIPAPLLKKLSPREMHLVLLHELAHFKRGDLWVEPAQILLQVFYWYNPLLWIANAIIRRVREQAVDEMVLVQSRDGAATYPDALLQVAKLALARPAASVGMLGILKPGRALRTRILRILNQPAPRSARIELPGFALLWLIALLALPMGKAALSPAPNLTADRAATKDALDGTKLAPPQAQELEARLEKDPNDLSARNQLLGYYMTARHRSDSAKQARQTHILWLIQYLPEASALGQPVGFLDRVIDGSAYEQAKNLWLKQVQAQPKNLTVLRNAAAFCTLQERKIAEGLLQQAQALEPDNPDWAKRLAHLHLLNSNFSRTQERGDEAKKALAQMESAQSNTRDATSRFGNLADLAKMAFTAGDLNKARDYAKELLKQADQNPSSWAYGNALHHGHVILGRIALREGKVDEARQQLLASGRTPGSPQLNSFGPNMALAKELLEKGEKETVLEFFKLCGQFWKRGSDRLDRWTKEIGAGISSDFGANLVY